MSPTGIYRRLRNFSNLSQSLPAWRSVDEQRHPGQLRCDHVTGELSPQYGVRSAPVVQGSVCTTKCDQQGGGQPVSFFLSRHTFPDGSVVGSVRYGSMNAHISGVNRFQLWNRVFFRTFLDFIPKKLYYRSTYKQGVTTPLNLRTGVLCFSKLLDHKVGV
jgi:hypothetical protein